jgi:succinate dehydrogenase/fumarate reductase iron-sulfur protein
METMTVRARVYRCDPSTGDPAHYDVFDVSGPVGMRILDTIRSIYDQQDDNLAFQYACRIGRCGTCAIRVNGRPVLACQERARSEMTIEPLAGFPVIRDLIVDRTEIERRYASLRLVPERAAPHSGEPEPIDPSTQRDVGLMGSCIACMICVSGCPAVHDRPFDGPMMMLQLRRLREHPADRAPRLQQALAGGLLECYGCDACAQLCPVELSPVSAIRAFRKDVLLGERTGKEHAATRDGQSAHAEAAVRFPRDSTHQTEGVLYGQLFQTLNRWTGLLIFAFLTVHLVGQGFLRIEALRPVLLLSPGALTLQQLPWVRALLFAAIAFHFGQGLRLIALDLGARLDHRPSFWTIAGTSALVGLWEIGRYVW